MQRREFLDLSARLALFAPFAGSVRAAATSDERFLLIILRGGLDGLAAVPPYGEPSYARLRGPLALGPPGASDGVLELDGLFGLHPALTGLHELYGKGELAVLHAVATPYRERSHFDGQKVLEAGLATPITSQGGWLNRALVAMQASGAPREAIALSESVPLVLRGPFSVASWSPSRLPDTDEDTLARVRRMYEASDTHLAERLTAALDARALAGEAGMAGGGRGGRQIAPMATAAARFLASEDGPRIAVIDIGGWDTHANQGAAQGNLANRLRALDAGIVAFREEMGAQWERTSVLVVTEFGRTVAVNGTRGTDHGTAGCAFLAGGRVAGGRVVADWPGLREGDLYEGRDLRPAMDLHSVFMAVLTERFGASASVLATRVFTGRGDLRPTAGLWA